MPKNLDDLGLKSVANSYDVFFIDIWGVLHNGLSLHQTSVNVLDELEKLNKNIFCSLMHQDQIKL